MTTEAIRHAYNPEAQAGVIMKLQEQGAILKMHHVFRGFDIVEELGLMWVVMGGIRILVDGNCDLGAFGNLEDGTVLDVVEGRGDFYGEDGQKITPIGTILHGQNVLYCSPGFNLNAYLNNAHTKKT